MTFDSLYREIDREQNRIDLFDKEDDEKVKGFKVDAFFEKLDKYQARVNAMPGQEELKRQQAELALDVLQEVNPVAIATLQSSFNQILNDFNANLDQYEQNDTKNRGSVLLDFANNEEFQEFSNSLKTEEERKELMAHMIGTIEQAPPLTDQQKMRLEQVELLTQLYTTLVIELSDQSKTFAQEFAQLSIQGKQIHSALSSYQRTLDVDLPAAIAAIKADPSATLEGLMPERIEKLRSVDDQTNTLAQIGLSLWSNKIVDIDFSDPKSIEDLNRQRFAILSFVRVTKNYDAARTIAEEALQSEINMAREALGPKRQEELRKIAREEILSQVESMRSQWTKEGLSTDQIEVFQEILIDEEAKRLINGEAIKLHLDAKQLTSEKKQIWAIYQDAFNVKDEFWEMRDEQWDLVKKEILINAPLILLSGGTASLLRAGVSRGTVSLASRIGVVAADSLKASRALRLGTKGTGLLVEGLAFTYTHSSLAYGLGIEEHHILELNAYQQVESVLWTTAALGLFHGVGSGIQKGAQRSATRIAAKEAGITGGSQVSKESLSLLQMEAAKITARPVRVVVQAAIAVNAEAGAMLLLAAAQEGVYKGDLKTFFEHFGEHVFHSYTAVLALKAGNSVAHPVGGSLKRAYDQFRTRKQQGLYEINTFQRAEPLRQDPEWSKQVEMINQTLRSSDFHQLFEGNLEGATAHLKALHKLDQHLATINDVRIDPIRKDVLERRRDMEYIVAREVEIEALVKELYPEGLDVGVDYSIRQGPLGNCYLLASIHAIRTSNPMLFKQSIRQRIQKANGGYWVSFGESRIFATRKMVKDHQEDALTPGAQAVFGDALLEYANAAFRAKQKYGDPRHIQRLDEKTLERADYSGYGSESIEHILGSGRVASTEHKPVHITNVLSTFNAQMNRSGDSILILDSKLKPALITGIRNGQTEYIQIQPRHAYSFVRYSPESGSVTLIDPGNTAKPFTLQVSQIPELFANISIVRIRPNATPLAIFAENLSGLKSESLVHNAISQKINSESIYTLVGLPDGFHLGLMNRIDSIVHSNRDPLVRRILKVELQKAYESESLIYERNAG